MATKHDSDLPPLQGNLRDQFAMAALTGLVTSDTAHDNDNPYGCWGSLAEEAYTIADAMMRARESKR